MLYLVLSLLPVRSAEVPPGFVAETIATNLNAATAIAPSPDGRIFIADQTGRLLVWKNGAILPQPALTLHVTDYWERGLIGMVLDPDFARVPYVFLIYVTDRPFAHHVLSRFTISGDAIDPSSEKVLLEGDDQSTLGGSVPAGHQGGALRFGSDGKLYVSIGEQTAGEPAQRLDTLQGKILRLGADGSIPEDNPFYAKTTGKYRSIYALGVRNSFGLAAQPKADGGRMFFTDVGGSAFEEINELKPGANYGWPQAEGFSTNRTFTNPLHAYRPMVGQSVVGGLWVPRSVEGLKRLPVEAAPASTLQPFNASTWPTKWRGKLLFGDFMKHWLKAIDPDAPTNVLTFARGLNGPVATEFAPDGSLLVLNRGAIWRDPKKFVPNAGSLVRIRYTGGSTVAAGAPVSDPARSTTNLAALGLPMDASRLPHTITRVDWEARLRGVKRWPFWLNNRSWQPFTRENVSLYLPTNSAAKLPDDAREIQLPPGAVVVRSFSAAVWQPVRAQADPKASTPARLIETRLLVVGRSRGYGASYRWRTADTAELVEDGELETFADLLDRNSTNEAPRNVSLTWWFPGVDDGIGFPITNPAYWVSTAVQDFILHPSPIRPERPVNWLRNMQRASTLETTLSPEALDRIPRGANWRSPLEPAEARVRSYLHGNCAVCHQPGGASRGNLDLRLSTPLAQTGLVNVDPLAGDLGIAGAKIVTPGSPEKSVLVRRMKDTGFFRMPPVAYHNESSPILPVVEEWIRQLKPTAATLQP